MRLVLEAEALPLLPGARDVAAAGERTGGDSRNRDFAAAHVTADGVAEDLVALAYDPQTAGGLLVAVAPGRAPALESAFAASGQPLARIGRVETGRRRPADLGAYTRAVEAGAHRLRARAARAVAGRLSEARDRSAASLYLIVVTGALVRLTASGLGCDSWPGCEQGSFFPEQGYHGAIEFSNRAVAILPIGLSAATAVAACAGATSRAGPPGSPSPSSPERSRRRRSA